jgi:outer membrane protein TolC
MRHAFSLALLLAASALTLSACASFSPDGGLQQVSSLAGVEAVALRTPEDEAQAHARVRRLLKKTLTADDAVRIALLNNRELQAAYNALGLSEAEMVEASLPPNPRFSIERIAGAGSVEVEARAVANILALLTLPARADIARDRFAQAQHEAANATLRIAAEARSAYYRAVAARSLAGFLAQSQDAANAAAKLSQRLGEAGNISKLDQARNQVFYAELSAQLATARQRENSERERLVRALGLWGGDIAFRLPASLPKLPIRAASLPGVEREAVERRLDLQIARLEIEALAKTYSLTQGTRALDGLEVAGITKTTKENGDKIRERGFEAEIEIPLFDFGEVKNRKAEQKYLQAVNRLAAKAVNVRSEARDAYRIYRSSYDIARHYQSEVLPLRKIISDETLLRYNAMQIDVFALLEEARRRIASTSAAIEAERDFFIAQTNLGAAIVGGGSAAMSEPTQTASAPESGGGH